MVKFENFNARTDCCKADDRIRPSEVVPREKWLAIEEDDKNNVTNIFRHYNNIKLYKLHIKSPKSKKATKVTFLDFYVNFIYLTLHR